MARFYSNENFPLLTVMKLRELGHEVATALEAGNANQRVADEAVLAYAISGNRAVLTINRKHFIALHHRMPAHCGIVVCSLDADFAVALSPYPNSPFTCRITSKASAT